MDVGKSKKYPLGHPIFFGVFSVAGWVGIFFYMAAVAAEKKNFWHFLFDFSMLSAPIVFLMATIAYYIANIVIRQRRETIPIGIVVSTVVHVTFGALIFIISFVVMDIMIALFVNSLKYQPVPHQSFLDYISIMIVAIFGILCMLLAGTTIYMARSILSVVSISSKRSRSVGNR